MKKQDMRVVKTRYALTNALMELMDKRAFEDIKVIDICERAQVHRTTFYKHFEDKYQLLEYTVEQVMEELSASLTPPERLEHPEEYYRELLNSVVSYIHDNERRFKLIAKNNTSGVFICTLQSILSKRIEEFLHMLEEKGATLTAPIPLLAQYRSGGLIASAYYLLGLGKTGYTTEELSQYLVGIGELGIMDTGSGM